MQFEQQHDEAPQMAALYPVVYSAWFPASRDIGALDTPIAIATKQGFNGDAVRASLFSTDDKT
ncbi:hypothetical protein [Paraburkholderia fungorum]|uniref:hypothetical protein n=1 Tax=Paraburkholderia fungorum TaxID=134537 RepID=UPI000942D676|nr:hypothetical protein [Paraburkholderia fungorum]